MMTLLMLSCKFIVIFHPKKLLYFQVVKFINHCIFSGVIWQDRFSDQNIHIASSLYSVHRKMCIHFIAQLTEFNMDDQFF